MTRSNVAAGKIPPPHSPEAAFVRLRTLRSEIGKLDQQLDDPGRIARYRTEREYDGWKQRARYARDRFEAEAAQLAAWLDREAAAEVDRRDADNFWKE